MKIEFNLDSIFKQGRIIAYSGGNFTSGEKRKKHRRGLIAKFYLRKQDSKYIISKVKWSFTFNKDCDKICNDDKYCKLITKKRKRCVTLDSVKNQQGKIRLRDIF